MYLVSPILFVSLNTNHKPPVVVSPTQNDVTLTFFDTPSKQHNIIQIRNNVLWHYQHLMEYSCLFPTSSLNVENILWKIVSPMKHSYESEECYEHLGIIRSTILQNCHLPSDFSSKFQSSTTMFQYRIVKREE